MNLSYAQGPAPRALLSETIGDLLNRIAAEHARNEALVSTFENRRFTYEELLAETNRVARALLSLGVQKGERVGIWSTNCVAWVLAQFATAKIGAVLVNLNPAYRAYELEFALRQSECNLLISGESFKDADYARMLHELIPELATADSQKDFRTEAFPHLRRIVFLGAQQQSGMMAWSHLLALADRVSPAELVARQAGLDCQEVINIQYTSGTTGFPKGAMLTHHNILNNGAWVGERMRLTHRDRLCIPVPLYHCFGMVLANLACVTHGATMRLPAPHFSPLHTLDSLAG